MLEVKFTSAFKHSYKLIQKRGWDLNLLFDVIHILQEGKSLEPRFKNHALAGKFIGYYECHIKPDWLLIYRYGNQSLILVDTGTHSDLLKM